MERRRRRVNAGPRPLAPCDRAARHSCVRRFRGRKDDRRRDARRTPRLGLPRRRRSAAEGQRREDAGWRSAGRRRPLALAGCRRRMDRCARGRGRASVIACSALEAGLPRTPARRPTAAQDRLPLGVRGADRRAARAAEGPLLARLTAAHPIRRAGAAKPRRTRHRRRHRPGAGRPRRGDRAADRLTVGHRPAQDPPMAAPLSAHRAVRGRAARRRRRATNLLGGLRESGRQTGAGPARRPRLRLHAQHAALLRPPRLPRHPVRPAQFGPQPTARQRPRRRSVDQHSHRELGR